MGNGCEKLQEILEIQLEIINRHIDKHKWFQKIESKDEAVRDFIEKYGFIMREFYCSRVCEKRFDCSIAEKFNPK